MDTNMEDDEALSVCVKRLELILSTCHYCSVKELGIYTSAARNIIGLAEETIGELKRLSGGSRANRKGNSTGRLIGSERLSTIGRLSGGLQ